MMTGEKPRSKAPVSIQFLVVPTNNCDPLPSATMRTAPKCGSISLSMPVGFRSASKSTRRPSLPPPDIRPPSFNEHNVNMDPSWIFLNQWEKIDCGSVFEFSLITVSGNNWARVFLLLLLLLTWRIAQLCSCRVPTRQCCHLNRPIWYHRFVWTTGRWRTLVSRGLQTRPCVCRGYHLGPRSKRRYDFCQLLRFDFDPMDEIRRPLLCQRSTAKTNNRNISHGRHNRTEPNRCSVKTKSVQLTRVSVILWPFSPRCHSHTDIILSGASSMAANKEPLSARLKHKLFTEPVNSPFPMIAIVANDTEFHTLICGWKQKKILLVSLCVFVCKWVTCGKSQRVTAASTNRKRDPAKNIFCCKFSLKYSPMHQIGRGQRIGPLRLEVYLDEWTGCCGTGCARRE